MKPGANNRDGGPAAATLAAEFNARFPLGSRLTAEFGRQAPVYRGFELRAPAAWCPVRRYVAIDPQTGHGSTELDAVVEWRVHLMEKRMRGWRPSAAQPAVAAPRDAVTASVRPAVVANPPPPPPAPQADLFGTVPVPSPAAKKRRK